MTRPVLLFSALALALGAQAQTYYGNGYTIVEQGTVDDRLSGLDAMVFKTIDAYSVQEGLEQLLQGSGWALAGADNADPQIWRLYRQPWPDNKRSINPMPLSQALSWVAGDGWSLVVDPVNRLVSFEINVRYAARPAPTAATVANAPAAPTDTVPPVSGTTRVSPAPYDPYGASVSYADSPSYTASHSTAGYGGSFQDSNYVASPHALLLPPPAGDDYNDTLTAQPPRKSVREVTALRPATTRLADLKTVSPSAGAEKSGKTATKKARKAATGDTPAWLPVSTGEKTVTRSKTAVPATARTAASASGIKATATTATENKTVTTADAGRKMATTPATEKATTATRKTATAPAATDAKAATPDKQSPATQATTSATPPAPAAHTPNTTSGESHP
ncbi:hypothetical protein [Cardiobacterium hominis]|uniref:hypothetical protein n=1 Tax=Cardiobacterium hominis TaxID=2718 RepID=UPI002491EFBF|nr:hypothetical protein [Cardiobacterium hominis]